jgi:hypothetical protein
MESIGRHVRLKDEFFSPSPPREEKGPGNEEAVGYCIMAVPSFFPSDYQPVTLSAKTTSMFSVGPGETCSPIPWTFQTAHTSSSPNPFSSRGGEGELK